MPAQQFCQMWFSERRSTGANAASDATTVRAKVLPAGKTETAHYTL